MRCSKHSVLSFFGDSHFIRRLPAFTPAVRIPRSAVSNSTSSSISSPAFIRNSADALSIANAAITTFSYRKYHFKTLALLISAPPSFCTQTLCANTKRDISPTTTSHMIPIGYAYDPSLSEDSVRMHADRVRSRCFTYSCGTKQVKKAKLQTTFIRVHCPKELNCLIQERAEQLLRAAPQKREEEKSQWDGMPLLLDHSHTSNTSSRRYAVAVFVLLCAYFVSAVYLIFFVFDWNLVEPTTFFTGQFVVLWGMWHHMRYLGTVPFSWPGIFASLLARGKSRKIKVK